MIRVIATIQLQAGRREEFLRIRPDFLAVTEDDKYAPLNRELCDEVGARYVVLPKTPPKFEPVSTSSIVRWVQAPTEAPLRVDFAGGDLGSYRKQPEKVGMVPASAYGRINRAFLVPNPKTEGFRAFIDIVVEPGQLAEMRAFLKSGSKTLTETWSFPWRAPDAS